MSSFYDLIIFDCDGTLVDTETLYNTITAELLNAVGFAEYTPALCIELFGGRSWTDIRLILEDRHQKKMPDNLVNSYAATANARMETELKQIEHVYDVISGMHGKIKICVGSNGERGNVLKSLQLARLGNFFPEEIVFTRLPEMRAKPAPDIFLHAAKTLGAEPGRTLVIEDSIAGVKAALAAGMDVIGFTGTAHDSMLHSKALTDAGAHKILDSFIHIPQALTHGKDWIKRP